MERSHSIFGPSGAEIWLHCTPAARFGAMFEKKASTYADEGTLCHDIATDLIAYRVKRLSKKEYLKRLAVHKAHGLYKIEMDHYSESFANYVLEIFFSYKLKGWADIWIETRVDYSHLVPEGYGHLDIAILSPGVIDIIDLKYGKGVPVSAIANPQLSLYGIGVIEATKFIERFKKVNLHIYQPRLDNISVFNTTTEECIKWGEDKVRQRAQLAFKGEGDFVPGSHCMFCPAKPRCKAAAEKHKAMAQYDFMLPYELDNEQIAEILHSGEQLINWFNSVKDYANAEARKGVKFAGFKLVEGKSNRRFKANTEAEITTRLKKLGFSPTAFSKNQLIGIIEMEGLLGKERFERELGKFIEKPPGTPTLVPITDRRHAIQGKEGAINDFQTIKAKKK